MRFFVIVVIALAACDNEEPASSLTCEFLQSKDNCWSAVRGDIESCSGPEDEAVEGTFNAELTSCELRSGSLVSFDDPLELPLEFGVDQDWHFAVSKDGTECARIDYEKGEQSSTGRFKTKAGTFKADGNQQSYTLTCPSGDRYTATGQEQLFDLFDCLGDLPGVSYGATGSGNSLNFGLVGGEGGSRGADGGLILGGGRNVFDCSDRPAPDAGVMDAG